MPSLSSPPNVWESVKSDFKSLFPEDVFKLWFEPVVCLESNDDTLTLGVPNDFAAIWIHDNYLDLITQRLRLTAEAELDLDEAHAWYLEQRPGLGGQFLRRVSRPSRLVARFGNWRAFARCMGRVAGAK